MNGWLDRILPQVVLEEEFAAEEETGAGPALAD
jgi:hypothetical protein